MEPEVTNKVLAFFKQFKHQIFKKGEILIRADENPKGIFYLSEGQIKQYAVSKKGEELIANIYKPGAFFPMSWAINNTANKYYFEATSEVEVYVAPNEEILQFVKTNPDVLLDLVKRLYSGLDGVLSRMIFLMSGEAEKRILSELIINAKRFGQKDSGTEVVTILITEQELANQTGMARETISRELTKLKEKKLISTQNKQIMIKNIEQLEAELISV